MLLRIWRAKNTKGDWAKKSVGILQTDNIPPTGNRGKEMWDILTAAGNQSYGDRKKSSNAGTARGPIYQQLKKQSYLG